MNTAGLIAQSVNILNCYYKNDIQPFIDAMHEDIHWYGPCDGQIISSRKKLIETFSKENNTLTFELSDMKSQLLWKDKDSCEIVVTFLVDTFYPGNKVIRCNQRVLLNWRQVWIKDENGKWKTEPRIRTCFIANAIPMDSRDVIYPIHFTETPVADQFILPAAAKRISFKGKDNSLLYLAENELVYIKSDGHFTTLHCLHDTFESSEAITTLEERFPDLLIRVHKSYLINPSFLKTLRRYEAEMTEGSCIPVSSRRYRDTKEQINQYLEQKKNINN